MKQKRYTVDVYVDQIAFALRQAESGTAAAKICGKLGVSGPTFYCWKTQFAGMGTVEIRRLKQLEGEAAQRMNKAKLQRLVADLSLDKTMLQDVLLKIGEARAAPRCGCCAARQLSDQRASGLPAIGFHRSAQRYRSRRDPQVELRMRLRALAAVRVRYG